ASYVSNKAQEYTAGASKEGNKEVAKGNTNASLGDRASAGIDAIGDKFDETSAKSKAEADKTSAKN
ncbi:uncharacterized protein JCM10292_000648, partial [Rhodotorula paludigena]|uniref:uncharacterized protein n=1 Tax=Rhodotorula paludigena TaxID=86838 RepID=UPI00316BB694